MAFSGYAPEPASSFSALSGRGKPFGFGFYEQFGMTKRNINPFRVQVGQKDVPLIILDDVKSAADYRFAARFHIGFKYNNRFGNVVTSLEGVDPRGDPFSVALKQKNEKTGKVEPKMPQRCWLLTGIELTSYTIKNGKNAGKVIENPRVLIPVPLGDRPNSPMSREDYFMAFATKLSGGLRGREFDVSRGPGQRSPRIGDQWFPKDKLTDAQLMERIAGAAQALGVSPADYIKPCNYTEVCKPVTYDRALQQAAAIAAEYGFDLLAELRGDKPADVKSQGAQSIPDRGDAYEGDDAEVNDSADDQTIPF
jgi:hypothetical protein